MKVPNPLIYEVCMARHLSDPVCPLRYCLRYSDPSVTGGSCLVLVTVPGMGGMGEAVNKISAANRLHHVLSVKWSHSLARKDATIPQHFLRANR